MSVRRLQKIKGGSYIISIPSDWVRKNGLDVRSELKVYEVIDGLKIKPIREPELTKEIEINDIELTKYLISVYYMQGVDRIVIKSKEVIPQEVKKELRELQLSHAGLEIEEENFSMITFRISISVQQDLRDLISKFIHKIETILEDAQVMLKSPSGEIKEDLIQRTELLMKDYRVIIRTIAIGVQEDDLVNFGMQEKDIILYAVAMRDLGRFLAHLKNFILAYRDNENAKTYFPVVKEMFSDSTQMFINESLDKLMEVRKKEKEIEKRIENKDEEKELLRMATYCVALTDDAVHKSVRLFPI
ncbi:MULTISPECIES: AbrB/MazE/SpoVT family DNA-binding domain-containing protein [Acidianus]|uniref:AbrB family transcriptional regulator n=1 Tax=Candidatus Acidianus copahuensis TaxID=1160895 RepID=A0A031LJY3_9CREN|nr:MULTISPECIES: phosphate uptake regulator PhoU [Acidianus]EZQ01795.1 AbrB family transcriptional regulator [Candidatus Acidianus copahuensis]NON61776.1 phosphate uptake regulator PhoU [Acidianus sp. RZ1]